MKILVSMRIVENTTYPEARDAISHDWLRLFSRYSISPLLIPNALEEVAPYFDLGATGLLLTGGDDLGDKDNPTLRDITENKLLEIALDRDLPVFGTCRGLQLINRHFGGSIARNLPEPHVGEHEISLTNGVRTRVNSFHNHGVMRKDLAQPLVSFAASSGDVVEGLRYPGRRIVAIQWHPERANPGAALDHSLLSEWLAQCA